MISFGQYRIAQDKLKLDLYNRRYAIYDALQTLRIELARHDFTQTEADAMLRQYSFRIREAQFLFQEKDGIMETLEQIRDPASGIIAARREMKDIPPAVASKQRREWAESLQVMRILSDQLERQLEPYLDFKSTGQGSFVDFVRDYFWG